MSQEKVRRLGVWEKYMPLWVALAIIAGTALGWGFPHLQDLWDSLSIAHINIPIAVLLFAMIYPIMVQISFEEVKRAARSPKPLALTLIANWAVKPFTMALFAWLFLSLVFGRFLTPELVEEYRAGLILLGVAPCTAMVLMWSYLARANVAHTLVMSAVNSLAMVFFYAPLAVFLMGIAGILVPWATIAIAVGIYIISPLAAGYITRRRVIKARGRAWLESRLAPLLGKISIGALLLTLVALFSMQGYHLVEFPSVIGMIALGIFVNILVIFALTYVAARLLRLPYEDAAPTAIIAGSNHFEVAIAVAITLFGTGSGAALATVVGVLTEVPFMLFLVWLCKKTSNFFYRPGIQYPGGE